MIVLELFDKLQELLAVSNAVDSHVDQVVLRQSKQDLPTDMVALKEGGILGELAGIVLLKTKQPIHHIMFTPLLHIETLSSGLQGVWLNQLHHPTLKGCGHSGS